MEEIEKILLMPIEIPKGTQGIKTEETIYLKNGRIYTTCVIDNKHEDTSDVAIHFYRLLYDFGDDWIPSKMFSGDTINSYPTVARYASEEKKNFWWNSYHCLANFWVLPAGLGRGVNCLSKGSGGSQTATIKSFNKGKRDYMDRFLCQYIENNDEYITEYKEYTNMFPIKEFAAKHYLQNIYLTDRNEVKFFSLISEDEQVDDISKYVDSIISIMWEKTKQRAKIISNSGRCDKLVDYLQKREEK